MRLAHSDIVRLCRLCAIALALASASCKREERGFRVSPPAARTIETISLSDLQPGSKPPTFQVKNEYEENAYALSEGKRLFDAFNCSGCHFHGGGGIGPPLMDDEWIYGNEPANIFATILEGRPNGMPSFRGKIPDYQVWQLAAYVRSMSGLVSSLAAPGRGDHMQAKPPEQSKEPEQPKASSIPKSAERP
jgi:cytochrome c oxidase cbb3-type subunit III